MKKRTFLTFGLMLLLTGCGYRNNARYLIMHPLTLQAKIEQCQMMGKRAANDDGCIFAQDVVNHAIRYSHELNDNQPLFGQKILIMQIQVAKLNDQIKALSGAKEQPSELKSLIEQRDLLNYHLDMMLALIARAMGM